MFRFDFQADGAVRDPAPDELQKPFDAVLRGDEDPVAARVHAEPFAEVPLERLVGNLPPSLLIETVRLAGGGVLLKRHMADVKFQVAAEDDLDDAASAVAGRAGPSAVRAAAAISESSDLVPGVYEGGLKTWECSVDLAGHLASRVCGPDLEGKRVLELGCGSALPSACVLRRCPALSALHVQDYNEDVLALVTLPNLIVNCPEFGAERAAGAGSGSGRDECRVVALEGDAAEDPGTAAEADGEGKTLPPSQLYDLVLTSETVYSPASVSRLCRALRACLRPPAFPEDAGGIALVAAKTFYFGVGGGTRAFCEEIERERAGAEERTEWDDAFVLRAESVWDTKASGGVRREIIKVAFATRPK
ncbi:MAG: hypothetical protein BJ554DRAFT_8410 [Olpidium bornovanus]|uniref:protein-histidine N-methyltransferase n=1 Tax=Olpidium bornovanus TaxID=278681 RepID=A0A8H7ZUP3_9FUNG|nr:MAG: hypothetical protein BJ554DRAFT_8410 [Olpidium bornovanus]